MAEPSQSTPAQTAVTVTTETGHRETTFREAMDAARSAVASLADRALTAPSSYARHNAGEAARECLGAMRADLEATSGYDRWVAIEAVTDMGDKLRGWERKARQEGYSILAHEFHEELDECERTRKALLTRGRTRAEDNGRARAM
jgi:DNA-binding LacI/PurR family transcriptional regulator